MKVLSLKQPFAELVVTGKKTIELRKWNTKFRGEFLVHASKHPDKEAMEKFGFKDLPTGQIIGKAILVDVKDYEKTKDFEKDNDKHLASRNWGGFGFILKDAKRITPIKINGNLGFWNYDLK